MEADQLVLGAAGSGGLESHSEADAGIGDTLGCHLTVTSGAASTESSTATTSFTMGSRTADQTLASVLVVESLHVVTVKTSAAGGRVLTSRARRHAGHTSAAAGLEVVARVAELADSRRACLATSAV